MSSRLRPQEFELSLGKSKHTERCAECVTQPTRMLERLTAAVARTLQRPRVAQNAQAGHFNGEPIRGGAVPHRSDTLVDILAKPAFGFSNKFPSIVIRWAMEDSQSGHGYPIPTSSTRASRYEQSDGAYHQGQPGRSFGTKANFFASCMSLISKSKMRKWKFRRWRNHHAARVTAGVCKSKSKQV